MRNMPDNEHNQTINQSINGRGRERERKRERERERERERGFPRKQRH